MKKVLIPVLLVMLVAFYSCNKLQHIPFDYSYHNTFSVPAATIPAFTDSFSYVVPTNIDSILAQNKTNPDLLQSAKLKSLTLTITDPAGQNFGFIRSLKVYVVTAGGDLEIAHKTNISTTDPALTLDVDDVELKPYLTAQSMTLRLVATTESGTIVNMTMRSDMVIHFEANLLEVL